MKNNLKVLFIQLCVLAIGCFIGEAVFGLPKWLGLVIAGLMFYLVFFIIQIKGAMSNIKDEVSSDGIAGARICGVFISAILLAFILGIYVYQAANIAMTIAGVVLLILQRRKIKGFFFENRWENNFWLVYFGIAFIICGVFSVFACLDIAPCTELCGVYRAIGIIQVSKSLLIQKQVRCGGPVFFFAASPCGCAVPGMHSQAVIPGRIRKNHVNFVKNSLLFW